jgi:putative ABC transport system substrate-binding protein
LTETIGTRSVALRAACVGVLLGTVATGAAAGVGIATRSRLSTPNEALVGYVFNGSQSDPRAVLIRDAFRDGLRGEGLVEGSNLRVEWRFLEGRNELMPDTFAELIRMGVRVLVAGGGTTINAAHQATDRVPIVAIGGGDLVAGGLAQSLARPGGNITGSAQPAIELTGKQVEILTDVVPGARRLAWITNLAVSSQTTRGMVEAAKHLNLELLPLDVQQETQLEPAFERAAAWGAEILGANNVVPLNLRRDVLPRLALRWQLPAAGAALEWVQAGLLLSYTASAYELGYRGAHYVARILNGADPAELPIDHPTVFDLVVNRSTLEYLGLRLPPHVAAQVTNWID